MDFLSIIVNKLFYLFIKILKPILKRDGSVTPGFYAAKISPNILDRLEYPNIIIGVTGSSGKGTTTKLIANVLSKNGYKVLWNKNGSNIKTAALTLILNYTNPFTKRINADVLLLELDESNISKIFNKINMTHLIVTNITRDQVARNGEPKIVYNKIFEALNDKTTLILNANDPLTLRLSLKHKGKTLKYGINKTNISYSTPLSDTLDEAYCPLCNNKLKYNYYHYGNIGNFACSKGHIKTDKLDYEGFVKDISEAKIIIDKEEINTHYPALYLSYSVLATYALCSDIGLRNKDISETINNLKLNYNQKNVYKLHNRTVELLDSKPENALTYEQTIDYILNKEGSKTIVIGFDNVSRRYTFNDISWLYDINFNKLKDLSVDKIITIGRFANDLALSLKLNGIRKDKIIVLDDYKNELKSIINTTEGDIYVAVFLDMMNDVKDALEVK